MSVRILTGDCRDVLRTLPDNSVDAIVTDPPYGLSFMGKRWDYDVPSVEVWAECLRVLKPGGHLLAFAGTRTQHRMAVRIEDAGFEIRDLIAWVYGSGFPKSLDVSKAIDKARTEDIEPVRSVCRIVRAAMDSNGLKSRDLTGYFNDCHPRLIDHWAARDTDSQPALPTWDQWQTLRSVLGIGSDMDAEVWRLNGRKGSPGDAWQTAEVIGQHDGQTPGFGEHRFGVRDSSIRAATEAARQWQGWGTALKPALEPITVARKPLAGTVAENVLKHGTGALNIDGCRVGSEGGTKGTNYAKTGLFGIGGKAEIAQLDAGRWPANLIHDGSDEVLAGFPDAPGAFAPVRGTEPTGHGFSGNVYGAPGRQGRQPSDQRDGGGSAARFFYCAKADRADRNEGLQDPGPQFKMGRLPHDAEKVNKAGNGNHHPTVKPTDLMRYLCRLVTPPGGVVLDPFMGSGSTLKAAELEGFSAIGIELDPAYVEIARRRIGSDAPLFAEVEVGA